MLVNAYDSEDVCHAIEMLVFDRIGKLGELKVEELRKVDKVRLNNTV